MKQEIAWIIYPLPQFKHLELSWPQVLCHLELISLVGKKKTVNYWYNKWIQKESVSSDNKYERYLTFLIFLVSNLSLVLVNSKPDTISRHTLERQNYSKDSKICNLKRFIYTHVHKLMWLRDNGFRFLRLNWLKLYSLWGQKVWSFLDKFQIYMIGKYSHKDGWPSPFLKTLTKLVCLADCEEKDIMSFWAEVQRHLDRDWIS